MTSQKQLELIPKIELHAHLSGSVRISTILDLLKEEINSKSSTVSTSNENNNLDIEKVEHELKKYEFESKKDLKDCFEIFKLLHRVLNSKENLIRVTKEVLQDFSDENTVYLELRTTPRNIYANDSNKTLLLSKKDYVDSVLEVIKQFEKESDMIVRIILSIDRAKSLEDALETIELYKNYKNEYIVGIDFSGNPHVHSLKEFEGAIKLIRKYNLKTTIHIAEFWDDPEVEYVITQLRPDRIGHAVCLNDSIKEYLIQNPIPIEICPTSNLITKIVDSLDQHPFYYFYNLDKNYPLIICTDDRGVFGTSLSREQFLIANSFNLSLEEMFNLNKNSANYILDKSEETIRKLNQKFSQFSI